MNALCHYTVFAVLATSATVWTLRYLRSLGFAAVNWRIAALILAVAVVPGLLLIQEAEETAREQLVSTVEGFGPVYARELQVLGHNNIRLDTPPDDPHYLALIESEKRWFAANPRIADIYTFHRLGDGKTRLWVDAETDYDHNDEFEGEREGRTAIGEVYDDHLLTPELNAAFEGQAGFQKEIVQDRWGTWVSAYFPLRANDGTVESVLGIDFPAEEWVELLASARQQRIFQVLAVLGVILTSAIVIAKLNARLLTAQKQEQGLRHSVELAQLSDRAKSEFLANMSHEMRTPLNGILGMADLLAESRLDAQQTEYLATARMSAGCLLDLVNQVLDLSKIEAEKLVLESVPYSIANIAREVANVVRATVTNKPIQVLVDIAPDIPVALMGDPTRVKQILLNLTGNAVKFTERGSVRITLATVANAAGEREVRVRVRDTGVGIPGDKLESIFHKFTQADSSTTRRFGGSGLGLSIARDLALAMGGRIDVESQLGVGSTFDLSLPLTLAPAPVVVSETAPQEAPRLERGLRVLLVEDNAVNRKVMRATLARLECVIALAENGEIAVELARANDFDAILMDCQMPVMDGYEATSHIRALPEPRCSTRIIAITANALAGDRERCLAAGMDDYVTKPIVREELVAALSRCKVSTSRPVDARA